MTSSRSVLTVLVWALVVGMFGAIVGMTNAAHGADRRALVYMPDMARSLPYNSFASNPVARDGKTLQAPVPGTVPRGLHTFRYGATPDEALRAGRDLHNPLTARADHLERGRVLYETFCLVRHGNQGEGDGPLVPRIPNPPSYMSERVRMMPPGQIFHVISRGAGRMPSYAAQVPYDDRWLIVLYVDTLRARGEVQR